MNTNLTLLALIPNFLRVIASAITSGTTLSTAMHEVLTTAAALVEVGDSAAVELQQLTAQVNAMVIANRDPTDDEWAALQARSDAAHKLIDGSTPA